MRTADLRSKDVEDAGRWYFRRDILEKLDFYFDNLARLKARDGDAYDLFSQVGGYVTNWSRGAYHSPNSEVSIDPAWFSGGSGPAFGMTTFIPKTEDEETMQVRLVYFQKVGRSWRVEPSEHDVYRVVALLAANKAKYRGLNLDWPIEFHVAVTKTGHIHLLREASVQTSALKPSKVPGYCRRVGGSVSRISWGFSPHLVQVVRHRKNDDGTNRTPEQWARMVFSIAANWQATATADVHIRVSKENLTGMFCVDMLRLPNFFDDRETGLASDGRRKRIFHIVRTHARNTKTGVSYVKSHFRGERDFLWNGYKINISLHGKHHHHLGDFTAGSVDLELLNSRRGYLRPKQVGRSIAQHMSA
jgi:hypothetical protein